ncbi:MAG TPA: hypothetical protein VFJ74_09580 [Gemmatimonadaceae bacterium]|nr:hypothetical protein [Gemmatimonadaceae bacterium]
MARRAKRHQNVVGPVEASRQRRVLEAVLAAAEAAGGSVTTADVARRAADHPALADVGPTTLAGCLRALVQARLLHVLGAGRTAKERAARRYLPVSYDVVVHAPVEPGCWDAAVRGAFVEEWARRLADARRRGRMPQPVAARDVAERLARAYPRAAVLLDAVVASGLAKLTRGRAPIARAVDDTRTLWAPAIVVDEWLEIEVAAPATPATPRATQRARRTA